MEEHPTAWVEHRVLRRSRNSALVEANPVVAAPQPGVHGASRRIPGYWIDQQELERRGFTRVRSRRTIFFATPHASDELVETLDALVRLGLWIPYSEDDLKQAFRRLALRLHPDAGGTDSRFIRLQDDFNRASQALNNHWWSE